MVKVKPLLDRVLEWKAFLGAGLDAAHLDALRAHARTGRPLGGARFLNRIETRLGRRLKKRKPGPKAGAKTDGAGK